MNKNPNFSKIIDQNSKYCIDKVVNTISEGKLAILPTNTAYGICSDARKDNIVQKVFDIKHRPIKMPISVFMTLTMIESYIKYREDLDTIFAAPQAFSRTAIVEPKEDIQISSLCFNANGNIGVRLVPTRFLSAIVTKLNFPITATSANVSGKPTTYSVQEIKEQKLSVDLIVNGGELDKGTETAIIDYTKHPPVVLRSKE